MWTWLSTVELLVRKMIARPEPLGLLAFEDELTAMLTRHEPRAPSGAADCAARSAEPRQAGCQVVDITAGLVIDPATVPRGRTRAGPVRRFNRVVGGFRLAAATSGTARSARLPAL